LYPWFPVSWTASSDVTFCFFFFFFLVLVEKIRNDIPHIGA
jgi:hypothetical protein